MWRLPIPICAGDNFDAQIFFQGWAAEILERWARFNYRAEREASEWFDIGGESE